MAVKSGTNTKEQFNGEGYQPLKICAKYSPPSIAILYTVLPNSKKKYLHVIQLPTLPSGANEIYQTLLKQQPKYLNPKIVSEAQMLRLIEQLSRNLRNQNVPKSEVIKKEEKNQQNNTFKNKTQEQEIKNEIERELQEESQEEAYKPEGPIVETLDVDEEPIKEPTEENIKNEHPANENEGEQLLEGFQRVYVEDLGQELLMDPKGNLYDLEGNLIGQAASDDEEQENPADDNQYFDNSVNVEDNEKIEEEVA